MKPTKYLGSRKSCFHDLFDHNSDAVGDPESDRFVDTVALNNLTSDFKLEYHNMRCFQETRCNGFNDLREQCEIV